MVHLKSVDTSDTANQAGEEHKELFDKARKLTETAATRQLYEKLIKRETGTASVEAKAFQLMQEKQSKEGKIINPDETIYTGRDPKVVVDVLKLKVKYTKEAEDLARQEYHEELKVVERKIEKGTRRNQKLKDKVRRIQNILWERLTNENDEKVMHLVNKYNVKGKVVKEKTKQEVEEDGILEGILIEDADLDEEMKDEEDNDIPIYGEEIEMDDDIVALLRKHPKFAMYDRLDIKKMKEELEVACVKIRWNRMHNGYKEDKTEEEVASEEDEDIMIMEAETKEIFDPENKKIDMRKRKATDIKTNQRIYLPYPRPASEEAEMMVRKAVLEEVTRKYILNKCNEEGQQKESNLNSQERRGLKKLLKMVQEGKIVVGVTDKSGKLCVSSFESFMRQGKKHVKEDREIGWKEVNEIQKRLSSHTRVIAKVFNIGQNWGEDNERRVRNAYYTEAGVVPVLTTIRVG